jgi:hypothetical protein
MAQKKIKNPTLRIIKMTSYNGCPILIQHMIISDVFQCIVFKDEQFYQAHNVVPKEKIITTEDELKFGMLMLDTAFQIIDELDRLKEIKKEKLN